jgi:hypothetical protein
MPYLSNVTRERIATQVSSDVVTDVKRKLAGLEILTSEAFKGMPLPPKKSAPEFSDDESSDEDSVII